MRNEAAALSSVVKHSLAIAGHRTSISLEQAFWSELKALAHTRNCSVSTLVADIDRERGVANLSSAIRVFVLQQSRSSRSPQEAADSATVSGGVAAASSVSG